MVFVKFCVCPSFPFGIEGGMWDVIVLILDHCLSVYFDLMIFKATFQCYVEFGFVEYNRYSRTSVARTLMARLPRLFRTRS